MQNTPISVVMATYNGQAYLNEQLDSILQQTKSPTEIIIIDDCSTDHTWDILKHYSKQHEIIKIIKNEVNMGVNKTFSRALKSSSGDLIFIADQDDIWINTKIEKMYNISWEGKSLVCSDAKIVDKSLNTIHESELEFHCPIPVEKLTKYFFFFSNCVSGHNCAMTRSFLNKSLPVPDNIIYDQWFALLSSLNNELSFLTEPLCLHRIHNDNTINKLQSPLPHKNSSLSIKNQKIIIKNNSLRILNEALKNHVKNNNKELTERLLEHTHNIENTILNIPLFIYLYRIRHNLFPHKTGWKRLRSIRNIAIGAKGYWLNI